jgi:predicted RNase H-like HicB family nuclease
VLEREEDGGYSVWVPELPGCASQGDTRAEALANIRDAIQCYLDALGELGRAPPSGGREVELVSVDDAA